MRYLPLLVLLLLACKSQVTEVAIISTLHGAHQTNENYTYDDLYSYIERFDPEIIGVEIRPEDIDSSANYLKRSYPKEMFEIRDRLNDKVVYGIDWLGGAIEGKPISEDYFQNLDILQLQSKAVGDSLLQVRIEPLESLEEDKSKLVSEGDIVRMNDGEYDSLNQRYYQMLDSLYRGTDYEKVADFYRTRDEKITSNILKIINDHPGSRILFVVGADHRSRAVSAINSLELGSIKIHEIN